jgi:HPt (histidine-containing phosphotransfer) domain-containing protein
MDEIEKAPVLDAAVVADLKELGGDAEPGLYAELVELFVADATRQIAALQQALEEGDVGLLERAAHTLKSSCAQMGAARLSRLCFELERAVRTGNLDGTTGLVARAVETYRQVEQALGARGV